MTSPRLLAIDAVIAETEPPALRAASELLGESLTAASGARWLVKLCRRDDLASVGAGALPSMVVVSLLPELARPEETIDATRSRFRADLERLARLGALPVVVCTIFRHVPEGDARARLLERIRRLDRMALDLWHDSGVGLADIDRTFAHFGARNLATDYRLNGRLAAELAGFTLATAALTRGMGALIPPEVARAALQVLGPLRDVDRLLERRLSPVPRLWPSRIPRSA